MKILFSALILLSAAIPAARAGNNDISGDATKSCSGKFVACTSQGCEPQDFSIYTYQWVNTFENLIKDERHEIRPEGGVAAGGEYHLTSNLVSAGWVNYENEKFFLAVPWDDAYVLYIKNKQGENPANWQRLCR